MNLKDAGFSPPTVKQKHEKTMHVQILHIPSEAPLPADWSPLLAY